MSLLKKATGGEKDKKGGRENEETRETRVKRQREKVNDE